MLIKLARTCPGIKTGLLHLLAACFLHGLQFLVLDQKKSQARHGKKELETVVTACMVCGRNKIKHYRYVVLACSRDGVDVLSFQEDS
jgi:5-methylcytosine-specific restriction endonuclease McrA